MAFSDFKYPKVVQELGLTETSPPDLFGAVPPVPPGDMLLHFLERGRRLGPGAHTEFSRSVWMVGPLLGEVWDRYRGTVCLIGGAEFDADPAARLTGACDFVFGRGPQRSVVVAPSLVVFEAERDSIPDGLGQCIAAMVGAQRFNRREGNPIDPIFGCVTTGSVWKFLRLSGSSLEIDLAEYGIKEAARLVGLLMHMIGPPPAAAPAAA
ncbi:MAG: hypothetical protein K2X87_30080 [Gemmataceae bacterium]|nr:hypothetical protein [Gemmataceae bacterium]